MHRIVHLDLKGAPWKVPYLEKVLISAKEWGATGVLFEWEDTFPFIGDLVGIGSLVNSGGDGMYSVQEVHHIFQFCKEIGLEAIQLIQTIGHMEYVLKHEQFKPLRESPRSPAVLCPCKLESQALVRTMLQQALDMQPEARFLHIGADEVWYTAICPDCQLKAATNKHKAASLFLDHILHLYQFIVKQRPFVTILMWDDMLRSIPLDTLKEYDIGASITPVLWHYNAKECFRIDPALWDNYRQLFRRVWVGSAFKGASTSCQILCPVNHYVSNHEAWIQEMERYNGSIDFSGIILTGWSRYDHYATLCELLPVSLPCLASCLRLLTKYVNQDISQGSVVSESLPAAAWAGEALARAVHSFAAARDRARAFIHGDLVATWLNPWQIANNYTNPVQIDGLAITAQHLLKELSSLETTITGQLITMTGARSTDEWVRTLIAPLQKQLAEIRDEALKRTARDASVTPIL